MASTTTFVDQSVQTDATPSPSTESNIPEEGPLPWTADEEEVFRQVEEEEDNARNIKIKVRWHHDHYLDEAGNLWERSDPNRPERSDGWSDTDSEYKHEIDRLRILEQNEEDEE